MDKLKAFSVADASSGLGISTATLYRMVGRGDIKVVKVGSRTLVPMKEVERILEGRSAPDSETSRNDR